MRFWDTSGLAPLLLEERHSSPAVAALRADRAVAVWWATPVECLSAIARAEREGRLQADEAIDAVAALRLLQGGWSEIDATSRVREIAERLVRTHPLRSADACQLAAAIVASEESPATLPFVTLDDRLATAAVREGFTVLRFDRP